MKKEPISNIGFIHDECATERKAEWQAKNKNTIIPVGKHVKLAFKQRDRVEHMWVKVTKYKAKKKEYTGILDNDPVIVTNVKDGDIVTFNHEDIEDYYIH